MDSPQQTEQQTTQQGDNSQTKRKEGFDPKGQHPLKNSWTLYYHAPSKKAQKDNFGEEMREVITISSVCYLIFFFFCKKRNNLR